MKRKKTMLFLIISILTITITTYFSQSLLIAFSRSLTEKLIISSLNGYEHKNYTSCTIYFTKKDKENANLTALMVSTYLPMLKNDFKLDLKKPTIIIYPNEKELKKVLKYNKKAPMGAYYGGILHILSPESYLSDKYSRSYDFIKKGPIIHELTHYFVDIKTNGKYKIWFTEGIALYFENKYLGYEWHNELEGKTNVITKSMLEKSFTKLDESLAYRKSYEIIKEEITQKYNNDIEKLIKAELS